MNGVFSDKQEADRESTVFEVCTVATERNGFIAGY
jgi:hypothetical protein